MALNHFIKKTLGFKLLDPNKPYVDPALKQGARFNKMQHQITESVLPDLPLMSQTTGPNLGSLVETLANRKSSETALEKLDKKEFKKFEAKQNTFNKLLSELATKQQNYDATVRGIQSLDHLSDGSYGSGKELGDAIKNDLFTRSAEDSRKHFGKGKSSGSSKETDESELSQFYRNQWGCGDDPCHTPRELHKKIQHLNRDVMKKANKMVELARHVHSIDEKVETKMAAQSQQLRTSLAALRKFKNQKNNLISSQQTLTGDLIDTRAELDSVYYHYLAWIIAAITLGALSMHHLTKSK